MDFSAWSKLLEDAGSPHVGLVYQDPEFLAEAVGRWIAPALKAGGGGILVGTPRHTLAIRGALRRHGADIDGAERAGRLVFVDADWLMAKFLIDGSPDRARFRELSLEIAHGVRAKLARPLAPLRAWGEMVSILRARGDTGAAMRLEALWTEVVAESDIALLCSYEAAREAPVHAAALGAIGRAHDELILQPEMEHAQKAA